MNWLCAITLDTVEGIMGFLPISSTGYLNIVEKLFDYGINSEGMTAFIAMIQVGAIFVAIIYFRKDIVWIVVAWLKGLANKTTRQDPDYTLGWGVTLGSIPVAVVGLLPRDFIEGPVHSMWVIAGVLIVWSMTMWLADCQQNLAKGIKGVSIKDALVIGYFQALSPVSLGIPRSDVTIPAGLSLRLDRMTATRLSSFLDIPALAAADDLEAITTGKHIADASIGQGPTIVATVVSGVAVYAAIAWLLKFVFSNKFTNLLIYRMILGAVIVALILVGLVAA